MGREEGDRFALVDAASQEARLTYWTRALAALDAIPVDQLSTDEKVNAQVFRASLQALANDTRFRLYETPFNGDTFFWTSFTPRQGLATAEAYRAFLARLRDVPRHFDEQIVNMRAGLARGFSVPRVSVVGRDATIEPYLKTNATNPLLMPFTLMPETIPAKDQEALRAEATTVIRDIVAPAYERLLAFMRNEYLPKTRTTLAAVKLPDGEAYYEQAMDYLRARAALSEHEITTEIERYIAWPGQALAYKLGEIQIRGHRRDAEEKLGPKFDQRKFHDVILALGSVPLAVLEERMSQFIKDGGEPRSSAGR